MRHRNHVSIENLHWEITYLSIGNILLKQISYHKANLLQTKQTGTENIITIFHCNIQYLPHLFNLLQT